MICFYYLFVCLFSGTESSIYVTGVAMVTGSLLPSHSDVQLSCLTGERIKVTENVISSDISNHCLVLSTELSPG